MRVPAVRRRSHSCRRRDRMRKEIWRVFMIGIGAVAIGGTVAAGTPASGEREGNSVSGQVVDATTHNVLDAVRVTVKGTGLSGRTAEDGSFFIDKIQAEQV